MSEPIESLFVCPLCGHQKPRLLFTLNTDEIVECPHCTLQFAVTPQVVKGELYDEGYFNGAKEAGGYQDYRGEYLSHNETFSRRLVAAEEKLGHKGTLFDCGCAYGHLGHVARGLGWNVIVADIAFDAVLKASTEFNLLGFVCDVSKPPLKPGSFDLITLYDVIEHVEEPQTILKALSSLLKKDGLLHITTPDVRSLSRKVLGKRWYHYKPREHLFYFNRHTIERYVHRSYLSVVEMRSAPSHMTLHDIFVRLRYYSGFLANLGLKALKALKLLNFVVKIHIGEMQLWAKQKPDPEVELFDGDGKAVADVEGPKVPNGERRALYKLLPFLACPECTGDLKAANRDSELRCSGCGVGYEVRSGIPILLPKTTRESVQAPAA